MGRQDHDTTRIVSESPHWTKVPWQYTGDWADFLQTRYLTSMMLPGVVKWQGGQVFCDPTSLRAANVIGLLTLSYIVLLCRQLIEARLHDQFSSAKIEVRSNYATHTALNIGLFPLLFFFSGLYYTDISSTVLVAAAFLNHLVRIGQKETTILGDFITIYLGLVSLFMRQTNVFWVVVFIGGLEAVHAIKLLKPEPVPRPQIQTLWGQVKFSLWRYSLGDVHDPPLGRSWPEGTLLYMLAQFFVH
jgi:alpha-1,2-glucosyltransferase